MTYSNTPVLRRAWDAWWSGTSTPPPNLRLGSDVRRSLQIARTIWPALHPKGRRSYGHYDAERVNNAAELVITGCISQRQVSTQCFCGGIERKSSKYTMIL